MSNAKTMNDFQNSGIIAETIIHIATMTEGEYLAEPFLSAFEDDGEEIWAALGLDEATIEDCPDDVPEFLEILCDHGLLGFLVQISTPVPHAFNESGYSTYGWGHTRCEWFYGESLEEIYSAAATWQEAFIEDRRRKAQEEVK